MQEEVHMRTGQWMTIVGVAVLLGACSPRGEEDAREAAREAEEAARKAGRAVENAAERAVPLADAAATTAEVKTALVADAIVSAFNVDVDTSSEQKTVTLRGTVDTEQAKAKAEAIAREKAAGYAIRNELKVDASAPRKPQ
jgi:osmotically-inducible protein OsmY